MNWVLSHSSSSREKSTMVFQSVVESEGNLVLCAGLIGSDLPLNLLQYFSLDMMRTFGAGEMLQHNGRISTVEGNGSIPLVGVRAAWIPHTSEVLQELLRHFYCGLRSTGTDTSSAVRPPEGYRVIDPRETVAQIRGRKVLILHNTLA